MVHWFNNSVFRIRDVCHTQSSTGATPVRWKQSSMGALICKTIALFHCVSSDCFIELQVFHQVAWTSIIHTKKNGYHQFKKRQRKSRTDTAHVCASLPACPYCTGRTAGLIPHAQLWIKLFLQCQEFYACFSKTRVQGTTEMFGEHRPFVLSCYHHQALKELSTIPHTSSVYSQGSSETASPPLRPLPLCHAPSSQCLPTCCGISLCVTHVMLNRVSGTAE